MSDEMKKLLDELNKLAQEDEQRKSSRQIRRY